MITNTYLETWKVDQSHFGDPQEDLDNFQDNVHGFLYDFSKSLITDDVYRYSNYKAVIGNLLSDFKLIDERAEGLSYPTLYWVFLHIPSSTFYQISGAADSWNDDNSFGDDFSFDVVYPQKKFITVYTKEKPLDSWS